MSDCHLDLGNGERLFRSVKAKAAETIKLDDSCPMRAGGRRRAGSLNGSPGSTPPTKTRQHYRTERPGTGQAAATAQEDPDHHHHLVDRDSSAHLICRTLSARLVSASSSSNPFCIVVPAGQGSNTRSRPRTSTRGGWSLVNFSEATSGAAGCDDLCHVACGADDDDSAADADGVCWA
jgi:hypothetical protein